MCLTEELAAKANSSLPRDIGILQEYSFIPTEKID